MSTSHGRLIESNILDMGVTVMEANTPLSAVEFLDSVFETDDAKQSLKQHIHDRRLVSKLAGMRVAKGITQGELAAQMGCRQARVSKLEAGVDADLTLADLEAYAKATDSAVTIVLSDRGKSLAGQIEMHAHSIRTSFLKLVELSHQGDLIARGVAELHMQAFQNINQMLTETAEKLPASAENGLPYITIQTAGITQDVSGSPPVDSPTATAPPRRRAKRKPRVRAGSSRGANAGINSR
ncbi:MAG: helix-turn-helix transcriptional regulator [Planctomycetaceae bacterium]|nr:helix-turn-helix transcriptional regulator [Planctomycetaceae bacterium]